MTRQIWNDSEIDLLKKEYFDNRSFFSFFKHRSLSSVYHKASKMGLRRVVKPLKYAIDEDFFNNWSPAFSYFLGFFMADGNIDLKSKAVRIKINQKDKYLLEHFANLMKTNRLVASFQNCCELRINNLLIIRRLIAVGCIPGNSLNNKFPESLPDDYFFDFLRGYIDGDGSIYICKSVASRQKNVLRMSVLGSETFLKRIVEKIEKSLSLKSKYAIRQTKSKHLYSVTFNGEFARRICKALYEKSGSVCLERKKNIYEKHLADLTND
jgi:intein/homing endonuclease